MPQKTLPAPSALPPVVADNGANDLQITFMVVATVPRLLVELLHNGIVVYSANRPISDYSSLTPTQKASLRTMLTALRDETLTLESFV